MAEEKQKKAKNVGFDVQTPKNTCDDKHCPFHGDLPLRGKTFVGKVVRAKMEKSCVVEWERKRYVPKYERYEKLKTRIKVHNSPCIDAKEGDTVKIMECRPLSKTINKVIVEVVN